MIGIGLIGIVIAERLISAGYSILGWDVNAGRQMLLSKAGGTIASGVEPIFQQCNRVILSLPTHEIVADILATSRQSLRPNQLIIDTSTGDPAAAFQQAESLSERTVEYVDATISGSSEQLRTGDAVILAGAKNEVFDLCRPLLFTLAKKVFHTGATGTGAQMKLVTNLVLGLNRAALAEGLCFARQLGLDLQQTLHLLRESMSYSRIMDTKGEKMIHQDFAPQARLSQHLKDVRLMLASVEQSGDLPLTDTHRMLLERAEAMGLGPLDNSAIVEAIAAGNSQGPVV